ncbi:hypothetical protein L1049_027799 [Liquidambar formosana]|uniref:S phase cyclin A-associated protein in the endoplasmic reticulum N-terminal domain-containing protein n=1 Tax=Liquidambar formosana TaxID=63359 RepID=A0AAP0RJE9_LIQFO
MENSEEAVDDQSSGWFEVKKKHRNSSKFFLQGWVGGFSGTHASKFLHSQPSLNGKSGNLHVCHGSNLQKTGGDFALHGQGSVSETTSVSDKDEKGVCYHDKCVVNQDNESSKSPPLSAVVTNAVVTNSISRAGDIQEVTQKDKPVMVHKIKWGDLEDDALALHRENTVGAEIKFGDIGNDNLMVCRSLENANDLVSCNSSCNEALGNKFVETSGDPDIVPNQILPLSSRDKSSKENCKEVSEISSKDVEVPIAGDRMVDPGDDVLNCKETHHEHIKLINDDPLTINCPSGQEVGMMMKLEAPDVITEVADSELSKGPKRNGNSSAMVISQDSELLPEKVGHETRRESTMTASVGECGAPPDNTMNDDVSKSQIMNVLGGGDAGESKERFRQRLWCFLFENLNRAVDELYLLCELECDSEQMKEAILVLEEAASDFKELNTRVEEFENVKKSSPQLLDGVPVTMKTDHRRPHALSWEVRRMTTSPHRAEILSSSLEAFKKIQQERASMHQANNVGTLGPECPKHHHLSGDILKKLAGGNDVTQNAKDLVMKPRKQSGGSDLTQGNLSGERRNVESGRSSKVNFVQNARVALHNSSTSDPNSSRLSLKDNSASVAGKSKREQLGFTSEMEKLIPKKDKMLTESTAEKNPKSMDHLKRQIPLLEKDKEKRNATSWKSMDAWKEKRNWEDILASPFRVSSRVSHSPGMSRKSAERARILHDKLMSPEKKKKTAVDLKKEAEEKHARAMRIRSELENERVQKLQRTSEKLNRVNEWQTVRSTKLREGMYARHQRSVSRHEAFLAQVVRRAGDESSKVNEVRFITS